MKTVHQAQAGHLGYVCSLSRSLSLSNVHLECGSECPPAVSYTVEPDLRGMLVFTDLLPTAEAPNKTPERTGTNTRKHCHCRTNLDKSLSWNEKMI